MDNFRKVFLRHKTQIMTYLFALFAVFSLALLIYGYGLLAHPQRRYDATRSLEEMIKKVNQLTKNIQAEAPQAPSGAYEKKTLAAGDFILSGIIWNINQPIAVINDYLVGIGDEVRGCLVKDINPESATLQKGTETITILRFRGN